MRVAAVIPNWNGAQLLRQLFPTLLYQTRPFDSILVVDNGSTDDSISVRSQFGAETLRFASNRGFARAVNEGVKALQADAIAVLNNDVEIAAGMAGDPCSPLHRSNRFVCDREDLERVRPPHTRWNVRRDLSRGHGSALWGRPTGRTVLVNINEDSVRSFTAVLLRKSDFLHVGGLDEGFESYLEDVDFGLRCASFGYTGVYEPAAVAIHRGSATLGEWHPQTVRNIARNQLLLVARHYDTGSLLRFGWSIAVAQLLWGWSRCAAERRCRGSQANWRSSPVPLFPEERPSPFGKRSGIQRAASARRPIRDRLRSVLAHILCAHV